MKRVLVAALAAISLYAQPANATEAFKCPQWHRLAQEEGFTRRDLATLDYIMYRESRCNPKAAGKNRRATGEVWSTDKGLMQINDYSWVTYLRKLGIIKHSDDLFKPRVNLRAAKALYDYSASKGYTPWAQWRTSGSGSYRD